MKKTIIFPWIFLISIPLFSYTWVPFCPDSIHANNICFGVGSWKGTICSPEGMYLWEDDLVAWGFYTYGLPVKGAAYLDNERILVTMGDGSWSDGVYSFHLETHQFEVLEWIVNPNFLMQCFPSGKYFIGSQFNGLYESSDGLTWTAVPFFEGKSCTAMDYYENHLLISEVSNIYNLYWSDDYGETWQEASGNIPMITDFKFSFEGDLYGIFPSYSNSSGLYSSNDFGQTWNLEFYSDNMSAVAFDAMSTAFVGWESPTTNNEGIAIYTPLSPPPNLAYLNVGLPNLNINKILMNPTMSAIAIFCCTDAGVYVCYDYMVGNEENLVEPDRVEVYPNPFTESLKIDLFFNTNEAFKIELFSNSGEQILRKEIQGKINSRQTITLNPDKEIINLVRGIYFVKLTQGEASIMRKVVYSK